jgi:hypothetical protein
LIAIVNDYKNAKSLSLALIVVKILFVFSLKIKRLQRIAGTIFTKMPYAVASKN